MKKIVLLSLLLVTTGAIAGRDHRYSCYSLTSGSYLIKFDNTVELRNWPLPHYPEISFVFNVIQESVVQGDCNRLCFSIPFLEEDTGSEKVMRIEKTQDGILTGRLINPGRPHEFLTCYEG